MKGDLKIDLFQKNIFFLVRAFPGKQRFHDSPQNQAKV